MIKKFLFYNHQYFYLILISLFFHLLAAYFSQGFYEQDEHFSILEPISFKFGNDATLGWDFFFNYDKQWFLSFLYFYLIKFLEIISINNPFQWAFVIRLSSSILGWLSIICLIHFTIKYLSNDKLIKPLFLISSFFWFYPYIHARAASENLSIIFLIFAITLFSFLRDKKYILLLCGIFFGLSFSIRFTNIFILGFFGLWAIFFRKVSIIDSLILISSFLFIFFLSILIDFWGYGVLFPNSSIVALNYFNLNAEWAKTGYFSTGTEAWWYNFYFIIKEFLPPLSIIVLISIIVFWIISPKHMVTWMTLPYFVFLCTLPHKETRFLFPILMFSPFFIVMAVDGLYKFKLSIFNILSFRISKFILYSLIFINIIALFILSFTPANNSTLLYKYLYKNEKNIEKIYTLEKIPYRKSDLLINFYRNKNIYFTKITTEDECKKIGNEIMTVNDKIVDNYNVETKISEIQKFSYPKWVFDYSVICNLDNFFDNISLNEKSYFLINKFEYTKNFINSNDMNCKRIFTTIPRWIFTLNLTKVYKNISSWHLFECN